MLESLETFHKQLIALQQAGFDVHSLLLNASSITQDRGSLSHSVDQLRIALDRIEQQVQSDIQRGVTVDASLNQQPDIRPLYREIWHRWLGSDQSIEAMQPLLAQDQSRFTASRGRELSYLNLAFYSALAALALSVVSKITVPNLRQLQKQIDQEPLPGSRVLYALSEHSGWMVGALSLLVMIIAFRLIIQRTYLNQSKFHSTTDRLATEKATLLQWADHKNGHNDLSPGVLELIDRLYQWIGSLRSQQTADRLPQLVSLLVGGGMALLLGILLFKPMAETLQMIVEAGAPGR